MKVGRALRFISFNYSANSLYSLFADGIYRETNLGRQTWKSLIPSAISSLQSKCNREGFNGNTAYVKVRLGMVGNEGNDRCASPDSFVGLGSSNVKKGRLCRFDFTLNSAGNFAACKADNGDRDTKAMGYILIRWAIYIRYWHILRNFYDDIHIIIKWFMLRFLYCRYST